VPHLRHEDAPSRQLLRLRGMRLHQRLQLITGEVTVVGAVLVAVSA